MGDRFTIVSTTPGSVATATGISLVTAASAAAARTAIGVTASSHTSGTLAARPASPAAGDTYAVTTGAQTGARYTCFVTGSWEGTALPTASAAGQVPVSDGAGTAYTATSAGDVLALGMVAALAGEPAGAALISDGAGGIATTSADVSAMLAAANAAAARTAMGLLSGLDAARPAASTAGRTYDATDTGARYLDTGSAWIVSSAGGGPDVATLQEWSDTAYLSGGTGAAVGPVGGPGWSFAACVYVTTLPGSFKSYATYSLDGGARGWNLGIGQNTAGCLSLGHVTSGPTNIIVQTGAIATGWHKVAFAIAADGLSAQWSLDGSAAADVVIALTSYVAPNASSIFAIGRFSYASYAQADLGVAAVVAYDEVLSGAQLAAITATPSNGRILTPAGVSEAFAYRAPLAVETGGGIVCAGSTRRALVRVGTPRMVAR